MNDTKTTDRTAALASVLQERYSCRGYRCEPVPRATIERIVELAQRSPSWCNAQPWQLSIASGTSLERLREALPRHVASHAPAPDFTWPTAYHGVYQERRRACGLALYEATGVARGDREAADRQRMENFRFFGAPHVALVTTDETLGVYGAIDCGAYVGHFMLVARALGVASIAQAALAAYPDFWREHLNLPADRRVVCGISFGFEDPHHRANAFRTSRAEAAQVARWLD
jgi:nitroreductase